MVWLCTHTSPIVVDHCDRLQRGNFLSGLAVEDTDVVQVFELSGHGLLGPQLVDLKIWHLGEHEDFVVPFNVQLGRAALSVNTREGEVFDLRDLCCGDHGEVNHSIWKTKDPCWKSEEQINRPGAACLGDFGQPDVS